MVVKALPILPISDLRARARELVAAAKEEPMVITQRGRPQVVMLSYESYNEMVARLERLEDLEDIRDMLERQEEPHRPFAEYLAERQRSV